MTAENKSAPTERRYRLRKLFDDLEDRPLTVARGRAREQRANSVNGLAAAANDAADVSSSKLQLKDGRSAAWNFCEDHVVRKFDQLANDELEKLSHAAKRLTTNPASHNSCGATAEVEFFFVNAAFLPRPPPPADHMADSYAEDSALYSPGELAC